MLELSQGNYSRQAVIDALHGKHGARELSFRYDLLDKSDNKKGELTTVEDASIDVSSLADIKRTAKFTLRDDGQIDWLSDRIQPFAKLRMPDGGYAEYPLGIFLLSSPTRKDGTKNVYRDVDAYDGLQVLLDDKFDERYTVTAGTRYYDAFIDILQSAGIIKWNIEQTDKVLGTDIEFEPGKEKLYAINELLRQINYDGLKHDVYGYYTSAYYRSPSVRASEYTYKDDSLSITLPGMEETLDLFSVPNEFVVVMSNPEQNPLVSTYTNESVTSPTSTVNRGRTIVDYRTVDNIADQQALDGYTQRIAFEASQIYGTLSFETAINPCHDIDDVLQIEYSRLGISDKYSETKWSFQLKAGATMKHECRKVVNV